MREEKRRRRRRMMMMMGLAKAWILRLVVIRGEVSVW